MKTEHDKNILVAGAGGFIGGHLVNHLIEQGYKNIRAVDIKSIREWHQLNLYSQNLIGDLRENRIAGESLKNIDVVYNLAADMGGMGFISKHPALCVSSVLINSNLLKYASEFGVSKYFYASSACVYNETLQTNPDVIALKESDAYPAQPDSDYGFEKLFSERACLAYNREFNLPVRIARFHNIYGPHGDYNNGREKAPAAICRKVIQAKLNNTNQIEIWGNGNQSRSFAYIDDCIKGIQLITNSNINEPLNLGSSELVTINQLISMVEEIANIKLKRIYTAGPVGVNGRNSDNTLIKKHLSWEPDIKLKIGLEQTYAWIYNQIKKYG